VRHIVNALLVRNGCVLLARRAPHRKAYPAQWSFPGGHVEAGETLVQGLVREMGEEIGVTPTRFVACGTIADPNEVTDRANYHMFVVSEWTGEPRLIGGEHTMLQWIAFDAAANMPGLALEEYRPLLRALPEA
jgi:8-oxo-dGTP diphosphatase